MINKNQLSLFLSLLYQLRCLGAWQGVRMCVWERARRVCVGGGGNMWLCLQTFSCKNTTYRQEEAPKNKAISTQPVYRAAGGERQKLHNLGITVMDGGSQNWGLAHIWVDISHLRFKWLSSLSMFGPQC